ncbi:hypothetical protein CPC08DRAFT_707241, partial [Agrocybe pediades]
IKELPLNNKKTKRNIYVENEERKGRTPYPLRISYPCITTESPSPSHCTIPSSSSSSPSPSPSPSPSSSSSFLPAQVLVLTSVHG